MLIDLSRVRVSGPLSAFATGFADDMGIKERALAATAPAVATPGRFRPNDKLLAFLEAL